MLGSSKLLSDMSEITRYCGVYESGSSFETGTYAPQEFLRMLRDYLASGGAELEAPMRIWVPWEGSSFTGTVLHAAVTVCSLDAVKLLLHHSNIFALTSEGLMASQILERLFKSLCSRIRNEEKIIHIDSYVESALGAFACPEGYEM